MPKLRFAIGLPLIHVVLAAVLFSVGNHARFPRGLDTPPTSPASLVCMGISAPVFPLIYLDALVPRAWYPASVLGFGVPQIFFLLGVVAVWYLVGWNLDRRWSLKTPLAENSGGRVPLRILLILLGAFLFFGGVTAIRQGILRSSDGNAWGYYIGGALFLAWSIALIGGSMSAIASWAKHKNSFPG
jgi:hypothetical protein